SVRCAPTIGPAVADRGAPRLEPTAPERPTIIADQLARPAPAPDSAFAAQRQRVAERRKRVSKPAASPAVGGAIEEKSRQAPPVTGGGVFVFKGRRPAR